MQLLPFLVTAFLLPPLAATHECFDCVRMGCVHFAECSNSTGVCDCPVGFGGADCATPVCGSLPVPNQRRPLRPENATCACDNGYYGVNCNLCAEDNVCAPFMPAGADDQSARCYTGGVLVNQQFKQCDVVNAKLVEILDGRKAEVSIGCDRSDAECAFQLWIDGRESFFCEFSDCEFNNLHYTCNNVKCQCRPGELLCGKEGSLDLSEWLTRSVTGPGDLKCNEKGDCTFEEPEMDKLIGYVFGDKSIELSCASSECLHYSQVPGYEIPRNSNGTLRSILASSVLALLLLALIYMLFTWGFNASERHAGVELASESGVFQSFPLGLYFANVAYEVGEKQILNDVSGACPPGSVLAIMGGSGAGKTTLLDIIAGKHKVGKVSGTVTLNGAELNPESTLRQVVGFVDQSDDILVPTLTVYEHVLFSAQLRLPRTMSQASIELRVLETLEELRIAHLKDQLVGSGLSGGEKRRLVIACELVTSPSVLLLDEPTSGLDAYNAESVVENLVSLAKNGNRTIVFTIHQPRSNIVKLFDRIMLLAAGRLLFTGNVSEAAGFFESVGFKCPPHYNIADYMIDVSMKASEPSLVPNLETNLETNLEPSLDQTTETEAADVECLDPEVHLDPLNVEPDRQWQDLNFHRNKISHLAAREMLSSATVAEEISSRDGVSAIITAFHASPSFARLAEELQSAKSLPVQSTFVKRASLLNQFGIIAQRILKTLYRDPQLVLTHYLISLFLAVLCGYLYFRLSNDISGFQNRLGLFFFLLAVFGFSTLTSVSLFMRERLMFMRERANGYYHPLAYYSAKVLLDTVPLRVGPPLVLGLVLYPLVGLNMEESKAPLVFLVVLTLFNLSAASLMLVVGTVFADFAVASLVGCMINLFGILFAGLFLNQNSMPAGSGWAKCLSIYHYAYEALSVNEVKHLTLVEEKFGLKIEVPGAAILSAFGFDNGSLKRDVGGLFAAAALSVALGYLCVSRILVERR